MAIKTYFHSEFLDAEFPVTPLLAGDILDAGEKMIMYGPSEAGKSYLVMQMALELAAGGSWFGYDVIRRCRVLILQSELSIGRYQERYTRMAKSYTTDLDVHVATIESLKLDTNEGRALFQECVALVIPDIVIVDPFRAFFSGDENESQHVERVFNSVAESQVDPPFAFVYVHHVRKSQQGTWGDGGSKAAARGSGLVTDRPSTAISLTVNNEQTQWTMSFTKTRNRHKRPEDILLQVNYKTGLFEPHEDVSPTTIYVERVMAVLNGEGRKQTDLQQALSVKHETEYRATYDWIAAAERQGRITRHTMPGQGGPKMVVPVEVES